MSQNLKINFIDFWDGFNKKSNYFYYLLSQKFNVEINENDPDLLFFSVNYNKSSEYEKYKNKKCKKIFFTGECVSPNFDSEAPKVVANFSQHYSISKCDISFSFDKTSDENFRLPLWVMYLDWFNVGGYGSSPSYLLPINSIFNNDWINFNKDRFCVSIFSNPTKERLFLFNTLTKCGKVDGFGKPFGNHSNGELDKYNILKKYRFSICPENKISKGYFTEKLFHAKTSGTIPIYSYDGDDLMDFNENCFINPLDFNNKDDLVEFVTDINSSEYLYEDFSNRPLFNSEDSFMQYSPDNVLKWLLQKI